MPLCDTFKDLSINTWRLILKGRNVNFQLKEETFTDLNMLELKVQHRGQIKTKIFTKNQEGRIGADWEWWFKGLNGNYIGFRVQAKIINIQTDQFEHLHYQKNNDYQCEKLITNALNANVPLIPLYCLFIQTDNTTLINVNNWPCGTTPFLKELYGCSLISAFSIRQLRARNLKHLNDLKANIKPWHCLVCCKHYGSGDFIDNIYSYSLNNFDFTGQDKVPDSFVTNKPPSYVLSIIENESNDNIKLPDEELDGVFIFLEVK